MKEIINEERISKIIDIISKYNYAQIFDEVKKYLNFDESPSLYLISIFFFLKLLKEKKILKKISDNDLKKVLKKLKLVNDMKIKISGDGTWEMKDFYVIIATAYFDYINCIDVTSKDVLFENIQNHIFSMYQIPLKNERKKKYPTFSDVVGLDEAKEMVYKRIIKPSLYKEYFDKYDIQLGGGVLLFGLPGTGKTMFSQAVANEINAHFISVKGSDLKSKYYGETEQKIKDIFEEASNYKMSVIFFDEFEAIGVSRNKFGSEITASSIVPELLAQLQGFEKRENVLLVIAATNRPWDIDSALLRPGRFDTLVYVDLPNEEARKLILSNNLKKINISNECIDLLVDNTKMFNGSDIKHLSDNIIRFVIDKEIEGYKNYQISLQDAIELLRRSKSSVYEYDVKKMKEFMENHHN